MNKRQLEMIADLRRKSYTLETLAQKYEVSQRTVRNDLARINEYLADGKLPPIRLERGGVLAVPEGLKNGPTVNSEPDYYSYKMSKEERWRRLPC